MESIVMRRARKQAGYRELYAIENGNRREIIINGHKCYKFTYSRFDKYQDTNGATYDTETNKWID